MQLTMNPFRRPTEKYTEEEYNEMRRKVQDLNLSRKDEWLLIWHAIKTLLPGVLLTLLIAWGLIFLIILLLP